MFKCRQFPLNFSRRFLGATCMDAAQNESRGGLSLFWPPLFRSVQLEGELSHYLEDTSTGQGARKRAVWRGRRSRGLKDRTERSWSITRRINRILEVWMIQHVVGIGTQL